MAPTALPTLTATRVGSNSSNANPLSCILSRAATTANMAARSIRLISRWVSPAAVGSKSHSPATWERKGDGSKKLIRRVAVRPAVIISQKFLVPLPPGAITPMPVITTRDVITASTDGAGLCPGEILDADRCAGVREGCC